MRTRPLAILAAVLSWATCAEAQVNPGLKPMWGAMFGRIDAAVRPYEAKLGLNDQWHNYCLTMVNAEEDKFPKNGSIPLGANWNTMDDATFKTAIAALENYRTSAMMLCLADVKARLGAAER